MSKGIFAFFSIAVFMAAIFSSILPEVYADRYMASETSLEDKVVMVVADYLGIEDINRMEFLGKLAAESHIALMNNRQPGKAGADKSKLIIGSGKRLELGGGGSASKPGRLVYTDLHKLMKRNAESEYKNYIGYLGEAIKKNKGVTCLIGNSDTSVQNRSSILITMDKNGGVDLGETEDILMEDESFPYGKRTDYNKLAELYKQYLAASSFLVVETGDMERLEKFRDSMTEVTYEAYKREILEDIDGFVEELISYGDFKTMIFISTYPSRADAEAGSRLTPVVAFDASGGGLLYSGSTRREGIILNTDLADYILYKLGYRESSALDEIRRDGAGAFLETMNRNIVRTSVLRLPILTSYAVMIIAAIVLLFITAVFLKKEYCAKYSWLSSMTAYFILAFPLALLYLPTAYLGEKPAVYFAFLTAVALAFSLVLQRTIKDKAKAVFLICALQLLGLSIDILFGSPFMKQSVLGYDPVIGARFYGIGNEYAGMFIGSSIIVFCSLRDIPGKKLGKGSAILYFTACTSILGLAFLGANFGGAVAGASGYILAYFLVYSVKFNKRNTSAGILILCAAAAFLIVSDSLGISSPSHMGSLVQETGANGIGVITSTIQRKISMNLRLIRYTIWTKVLICIIAAISVMIFKPVKLLKRVFVKYRYLEHSWISIAVSAIIGFAVNDSGIVLAATAMIYVAFSMLLICISERNEA